jgi:hypothetical protein
MVDSGLTFSDRLSMVAFDEAIVGRAGLDEPERPIGETPILRPGFAIQRPAGRALRGADCPNLAVDAVSAGQAMASLPAGWPGLGIDHFGCCSLRPFDAIRTRSFIVLESLKA